MRENLINIINKCQDKAVKKTWIEEMIFTTDIECSESQCIGCLIAKDCLEVTSKINRCLSDCKVDPEDRCYGCNFVGHVYNQ